MLLSIIIPVYNVEKFVEKCIRSCESQDIPKNEYELIVVNDGATDNSLQVVEYVARDYENITIISQSNAGLSAARNTGMVHACGEYYMFVDSDDWIAENCLGKLVGKLKAEKPDCLAFCAADMIGDKLVRRRHFSDEMAVGGYILLERRISPCAQHIIWKAGFLQRYNLKFMLGILHEDSEFTPRALYKAQKVSLMNDIIYYVYQNPNSITRTVNPKRSFDIIRWVCTSLEKYSEEVKPEHLVIFHNLISLNINNALSYIGQCDKERQRLFDKEMYKHRKLFSHLLKSSVLKYRMEGVLFILFPWHTGWIYKLIQTLNRKRRYNKV